LDDLKRIYGVPDVKKLNQKQQVFYLISILFPLLMVYSVLHLYALPFGYYEEFKMEDLDISKDFFYTIDGEEVLDGIAEVTVSPRIAKANVFADIKIEGDENLYIIPEKIAKDDLKDDVWDKEWVFEEDFDYLLLDDYEVKEDAEYLTFKIEIEIDKDEVIDHPQVIMKYKGLMLIRHQDVIEWRRMEVSSIVHRMFYHLEEDDFNKPISILTTSKPIDGAKNTNGVFTFYVNGKLADTRMQTYRYKNADDATPPERSNAPWDWNRELRIDTSQKHISLKQEAYTHNFKQDSEKDLLSIKDAEKHYREVFETEEAKKIDFEFKEEDTCYFHSLNQIYESSCRIKSKRINEYSTKGGNILRTKSQQPYYSKEFFDCFTGHINKTKIAYENPLRTQKQYFYENTKSKIKIVGANSRVENIEVSLYKEQIW